MKNSYDIVIIGAGPAGLFAGACIKKNCKTLILEKNKSAGKKLLMSGSGMCNITQSGQVSEFKSCYGSAGKFIMPALREFSNTDLIEYMHLHGLPTIERKGKIFPISENARDVLNLLMNECKSNRIVFRYTEPVKDIRKESDCFLITTDKETYRCTKVLIATGGRSYPSTGSTGDGYQLAKSLGHTIEKPKPALSPAYIDNYRFANISGVSIYSNKISLFRAGKEIHTNCGYIGFTHRGLSGPGILDISRYIEEGDLLRVNLVNLNPEEFRNVINQTSKTEGSTTIRRFLKVYSIPESLIKMILEELNLDNALRMAELTRNLRSRLVEQFCGYTFQISSVGGFNIAMATKGGVSLAEVSPKTMESRIVPSLFFAGEVIDIDGDTGGYNIQAAFSTARMAAKSMIEGIKENNK